MTQRHTPAFVCVPCGAEFSEWAETCPKCGAVDMMAEIEPEAEGAAEGSSQ